MAASQMRMRISSCKPISTRKCGNVENKKTLLVFRRGALLLDRGTDLDADQDENKHYKRPKQSRAPFVELRYVLLWGLFDNFLHHLRIADGVVHETRAPAVAVLRAGQIDGVAF